MNTRRAALLRRTVLRGVTALAALLAVCLCAEIGLRMLYAYASWRTNARPIVYERTYLNVPPWIQAASILRYNPHTGWTMRGEATRRYLDLFGPIGRWQDLDDMLQSLAAKLPEWAQSRPVWELRTLRRGWRTPPFRYKPEPGTYRVLALGDSWTLGVSVDEKEAYPRVLEDLLARAAPGRRVEVLNLGIIGGNASSIPAFLGAVLAFKPSLVITAYAQNDERSMADTSPKPSADVAASAVIARLELVRIYRYWRFPRSSPTTYMERAMRTPRVWPDHTVPAPCPLEEESLGVRAYRSSLETAVDFAAGHEMDIVLLYNNLPNLRHCAGGAMKEVARERRVPFVDSSRLLYAGARAEARERARALGLTDGPPRRGRLEKVGVLLRVHAPGRRKVFVFGGDPAFGDFTPNVVALFDDGTHGDQNSGDDVWSRAFYLPPGHTIPYLYSSGDAPGLWEDLENYWPRVLRTNWEDEGLLVTLPVARYGRQDLKGDPFHTDARGHRLIAEALAEEIRRSPSFRTWFAATPPNSTTGSDPIGNKTLE